MSGDIAIRAAAVRVVNANDLSHAAHRKIATADRKLTTEELQWVCWAWDGVDEAIKALRRALDD